MRGPSDTMHSHKEVIAQASEHQRMIVKMF